MTPHKPEPAGRQQLHIKTRAHVLVPTSVHIYVYYCTTYSAFICVFCDKLNSTQAAATAECTSIHTTLTRGAVLLKVCAQNLCTPKISKSRRLYFCLPPKRRRRFTSTLQSFKHVARERRTIKFHNDVVDNGDWVITIQPDTSHNQIYVLCSYAQFLESQNMWTIFDGWLFCNWFSRSFHCVVKISDQITTPDYNNRAGVLRRTCPPDRWTSIIDSRAGA